MKRLWLSSETLKAVKVHITFFDVFQLSVNLVERNSCPNGLALVDADRSGKTNQFDLVELAQTIQTADKFTRATAGSKLQVIAEQVRQ